MAARGLSPADVRAEAFAAAPANIWRAEAMPGYLRRLEDVRFGTEWLRQLQAGTLVTPRLPEAAQHVAELDIPVLLLHGRHGFPSAWSSPRSTLIRKREPWCWRTRATCCTSTIPTATCARCGSS